jgi:branched-chain amino acid transport system substrate-binding protein
MKKLLVAVTALVGVAVAASVGSAGTARTAASSASAVSCGTTRTIGFLVPATGPAASIGQQQVRWEKFVVNQWNKTHKTAKIVVSQQDTQLGAANGSAQALAGAQALKSNSKVLAVVGAAGSNENKGIRATLKGAGFGWVTGSATADELTTPAAGTRGYFFRAGPPDSQQGTTVANLMINNLKVSKVYIIDDEEAYSTGLADTVEAKLKAAGKSVSRDGVSQQESDFSSLIAKIDRSTNVIYIPWQLSPKAAAFVSQLKQAGKGNIAVMGSDGLYADDFAASGNPPTIYDSMFPVSPGQANVKAYEKAHGGNGDFFGAPTGVATQIVVSAIDRACKDGKATRAEVRAQIAKTNIPKSILGFTIKFTKTGELSGGKFGLYKSNGKIFLPISL